MSGSCLGEPSGSFALLLEQGAGGFGWQKTWETKPKSLASSVYQLIMRKPSNLLVAINHPKRSFKQPAADDSSWIFLNAFRKRWTRLCMEVFTSGIQQQMSSARHSRTDVSTLTSLCMACRPAPTLVWTQTQIPSPLPQPFLGSKVGASARTSVEINTAKKWILMRSCRQFLKRN